MPEELGSSAPTPWLASHAAVPFADHVRDGVYALYFSSRDARSRSHTARIFVDFGVTPPRVQSKPELVLEPGALGAFDDSGAMGCWLLTVSGRKYLYYIGWNLGVTVPFRNAVGLAISDDGGRTFARYATGPVIDRSPTDPFFTASAAVLLENGLWRMWYLSATGWELSPSGPRHRYHIKYAESRDGFTWKRPDIVAIDFASSEEYAISRPCVVNDRGRYCMWYSYRGTHYRIGYAESDDGIRWERLDDRVELTTGPEAWDSEMIEYPFVFDHRGARIMLYNGNDYGRTGIGWATLDGEIATS